MTTIAANRKCMAADRKVTDEGSMYHTIKIFVVEGNIVGLAGEVLRTNKFLNWMRMGQPKEAGSMMEGDEKANFQALVLNRKGLFVYMDTCEPDALDDPFYAIGCGSQAALAVMTKPIGWSPEAAVKHAGKVDPHTGGKTDVLWVKDL